MEFLLQFGPARSLTTRSRSLRQRAATPSISFPKSKSRTDLGLTDMVRSPTDDEWTSMMRCAMHVWDTHQLPTDLPALEDVIQHVVGMYQLQLMVTETERLTAAGAERGGGGEGQARRGKGVPVRHLPEMVLRPAALRCSKTINRRSQQHLTSAIKCAISSINPEL
jgi:hypothetical protein